MKAFFRILAAVLMLTAALLSALGITARIQQENGQQLYGFDRLRLLYSENGEDTPLIDGTDAALLLLSPDTLSVTDEVVYRNIRASVALKQEDGSFTLIDEEDNTVSVTPEDVAAKYLLSVPFFGVVLRFLATENGFYCSFGTVAALLLVLFVLIVTGMRKSGEKKAPAAPLAAATATPKESDRTANNPETTDEEIGSEANEAAEKKSESEPAAAPAQGNTEPAKDSVAPSESIPEISAKTASSKDAVQMPTDGRDALIQQLLKELEQTREACRSMQQRLEEAEALAAALCVRQNVEGMGEPDGVCTASAQVQE